MNKVSYYFSEKLTTDAEGTLVQLCRACAARNRPDVAWAGAAHEQAECEICGASNDPAYSRQLDAVMKRLGGQQ